MECNPLAFETEEQVEISETLYQILNEVRSLKERFERSDDENQNLLHELREEINTLRNEVGKMKKVTDHEFKLLPNMPFHTLTELREFDEMLPRNDALRTELKCFLQRFIHREFSPFLRAALRAIVTDELAVNLTWRGTPEKPSVQTFTVFVILRDLCHAKFSSASHSDINRVCQQHFLHAKDRFNKKANPTRYISVVSFPAKRSASPAASPESSQSSQSPQPQPPRLPPTAPELLDRLPISTMKELEDFDEKLLNDVKVKTALKKLLAAIHSRDYSIFIRSAFSELITDSLAMEMTWRGTKEKPSIQDFTIFTIIRDFCIKKFNHEITNADVNKVCQQYFLHARDRVSKKMKLGPM